LGLSRTCTPENEQQQEQPPHVLLELGDYL
jgi:hypothetical protein